MTASLLSRQRHLLDPPLEVAYPNAAYRTPSLCAVAPAGVEDFIRLVD